MKKPTCTFSYGGRALRFFHSYLKETKKNQQSILKLIHVHSFHGFFIQEIVFSSPEPKAQM